MSTAMEHSDKKDSPSDHPTEEIEPSNISSRAMSPELDGEKLRPVETSASEIVYPNKAKTLVIMLCLYISMFLVALDRTIIATAIPRITDQFHSINDIGWYGSSYLLTACCFILVYGRIYTFYSTKWTFLSGIFLFEVGSAICGAAPSSIVLIIGRAIAGFGSSGIMTGAITIMINTVPLHKRPLYQGFFGATFAVASVVGPLMGGAFTDSSATWRWCFYINLPLGGAVMLGLIFFLKLEEGKKTEATLFQQFKQLDPLGTFCFLPAIICLLLALQWGGTVHAWGSWRIILLLVVFSLGIIGFVAVQYFHRNTTATLPARIATQRSVVFASIYTFFNGGTFMIMVFYIPIWFQAIKDTSAVQSGIRSIPLILGLVAMSMICGAIVQRTGYYTPFMWAGSVIMAIGAGLVYTFKVDSPHAQWIGYQVLIGMGIGMGMQQANLAVQAVLKHKDIPTGSAMIFFAQTLGGTIFISVAQNLFIQKFTRQLEGFPPGVLDLSALLSSGATDIRNNVPAQYQAEVIQAYNYALVKGPFMLAIITGCLTLLGSAGVELKSTRKHVDKKPAEQAKLEEERDIEKEAHSEKEGYSEKEAHSAPTTSEGPIATKDELTL